MKTIGEVRRENLELLVSKSGTLEAVAAAVESSSVYLSQIRKQAIDIKTQKPREMGSKMARRFEETFRLPSGWMDVPHDRNEKIDGLVYDASSELTVQFQVKEPSATYSARPGEVAATMAKSLSGLSESRRKTIAMLVSAQIMDGANDEEVAAIDALAGDTVVTTNYDELLGQMFRQQAHEVAERHPDPATREVLTKFVLEIERRISQAPRT